MRPITERRNLTSLYSSSRISISHPSQETCDIIEPYGINFKIPRLSRLAQVNDHLLIIQLELREGNVSSVSKWAEAVGVEGNLIGGRHAEICFGYDSITRSRL